MFNSKNNNINPFISLFNSLNEKRCISCHVPFIKSLDKHVAPYPDIRQIICNDCLNQLQIFKAPRCPLCGYIYPDPRDLFVICGQCNINKPPWVQFEFYGLYEGKLKDLLLRLKYGKQYYIVRILAILLAMLYTKMEICHLIVAIPQYPTHLRKRGYNQVHELAQFLSKILNLKYNSHNLIRTKETIAQVELSAKERLDNPKDSFLAQDVQGKNVFLIDDVMTTGSTLKHASLALLKAGVNKVYVASIAKTNLSP